jgi:curved DNA-binding protein CbpA
MVKKFSLYDILGVEVDATEAQIRSAFRKLTFKHHPDRYSGDQRTRAEERFQEITEAFNVLSRPESREKYDNELAQGQPGGSGGAAMDPKEIARRMAAKGAQSIKEGNVTQAIDELKTALDHDENSARAQYFMGVALLKSSGREKDGLRHLEKAIALEPTNAVMLAEAATAALLIGMKARAKRFAEQAMSYDPTNQKAAKILQHIDSDESQSAGDGLFGRLRRKG